MALLALSPLVAADCSNSYNGYECPGSIYGTLQGNSTDISGLICCKGSSSCTITTDGSITKCDSGTQVPLANAQSSSTGAPAQSTSATAKSSGEGLSASGNWMVVVMLGAGIFAFA